MNRLKPQSSLLAPLVPVLRVAGALALLFVTLLLDPASPRPAGAQSRGSTPAAPENPPVETVSEVSDAFGETLNVTVVNVEVYVTDKQGQRIKGLTRDDFDLFENKKPVAITNFYAVEGGRPTKESDPVAFVEDAPTLSEIPAAPPSVEAPAAIPDEQKLSLIVYIDNFNLRPFNRNRVLRELRVFLNEKVRPGDRVMLVTYDRELNVRRNFTSDPAVVASALYELEKISAHGTHADSERRDILQAIDEAEYLQEVSGRARTYAESQFNDLEFTIKALKNLVDQMAGLPGRKAILYVSDGVPMRAAEDIFYALSIKFPQQTSLLEAQSYDASRRFQELASQANTNRVSFYTLEATGLRVSSAADASQMTPGLGVQVEQIHFSNLQSSLQYLAEQTGGMSVINSNVLMPRLERIAEDFNTYYSLGYTPSHSGDGRYHRIEVKLKNPQRGILVRHRDGYRDKPFETRMADSTIASLRFGTETNPLGVNLEVGSIERRTDGLFNVQVTVRIPLGRVTFVPREAVHEARLRVFVAAMDHEGDTSEVGNAPVPITVPADKMETAQQQHYAYTLTLVMRPGEQRVAIGVRDDLGAASSFVYKSLRVGA